MNHPPRTLIAGAAMLLLGLGCASAPDPVDLSDPGRTASMPDFAPVAAPGGPLPVEIVQDGSVSVGCNLQMLTLHGTAYYCARVLVRNEGSAALDLEPQLTMLDSSGLQVAPVPLEAFAAFALGENLEEGGIGADDVARYGGQVAGPLAGAMGLGPMAPVGMIFGLAADLFDGGDDQRGPQMAQWASTYWLPEELRLEPGSAYGGIAVFVAPRPLPVELQVDFGGFAYRFLSCGSGELAASTINP